MFSLSPKLNRMFECLNECPRMPGTYVHFKQKIKYIVNLIQCVVFSGAVSVSPGKWFVFRWNLYNSVFIIQVKEGLPRDREKWTDQNKKIYETFKQNCFWITGLHGHCTLHIIHFSFICTNKYFCWRFFFLGYFLVILLLSFSWWVWAFWSVHFGLCEISFTIWFARILPTYGITLKFTLHFFDSLAFFCFFSRIIV